MGGFPPLTGTPAVHKFTAGNPFARLRREPPNSLSPPIILRMRGRLCGFSRARGTVGGRPRARLAPQKPRMTEKKAPKVRGEAGVWGRHRGSPPRARERWGFTKGGATGVPRKRACRVFGGSRAGSPKCRASDTICRLCRHHEFSIKFLRVVGWKRYLHKAAGASPRPTEM